MYIACGTGYSTPGVREQLIVSLNIPCARVHFSEHAQYIEVKGRIDIGLTWDPTLREEPCRKTSTFSTCDRLLPIAANLVLT